MNRVFRDMERVKVLVKYGFVGLAFLLTMHCGLLVYGIDTLAVHILAVVYALGLGECLSRLFGLCWIHRLSVIYIILVLACIALRRFNAFGEFLQHARMFMFVFGVIVNVLLLWRTTSCVKR